MGKVLQNILSFGAVSRVEKKIAVKDNQIRELKIISEKIIIKRSEVNNKLEKVFKLKKDCFYELQSIKNIIKNFSLKERKNNDNFIPGEYKFSLKEINNSISIGLNYFKGIGTGVATTSGVWALVGTLGTASTGTAISTLSGAAASNATLAWFGGGSLATGGGGMAAGTIVLGAGIGVIILSTAAIFAHVKAGKIILEIEKDISKVISEKKILNDALFTIDLIEKRCNEVSNVISKERFIIKNEIQKTKNYIYPFGFISRFIKIIRYFFGGKYFSMREKDCIRNLLIKVECYLKVLDLKIIDKDGNPIN